ncbi:hypothetical protein A7Q09_01565 [Methylacidiphilum sp. Yel]|uniref:hypothetical protein n=1 Tax=Methylacidiphilum sp. Yel TaxID=1847730 RepID=UPI00106ACF21|nr:hypothetical protein [Methylacidiphilum sp. Yel]TFE67172.1 hypothetical protein A7Q09_01565 [Methylacidiphilum sp. Yel]
MWKVKEAVIEYHGNLNGEELRFGEFLSFWEKAGFVSIIKPLPITYPFYQLFKFESNCFPTNFLLRLRKRKEIFPTVENNKTQKILKIHTSPPKTVGCVSENYGTSPT